MSLGKPASSEPPDLKPRAAATVVARDTVFSGELEGTRSVRIEGTMRGTLRLKAAVDVVEGATVEAEVHATTARIAGRVVGDVHASELVELLATASVTGDLHTPALHVVEGATLEGTVQMRTERSAGPAAPPAKAK